MSTRWQSLRQELGAPAARLYLLHRLLQAVSGGRARLLPYRLYAQPLGHLPPMREQAGTRIWLCQPEDPVVAAFPRPAFVLAQRWANGNRCWVCTVKGRFAGMLWVSTGSHLEDEVRCRFELPADGVWDHDVYVEPEFRLGRTLARLWQAVDTQLAAEGRHWSFSRISRFNPASVRSHERLGARCVGTMTVLALGQLELSWRPGRRLPQWHWNSTPVQRLHAPSAGSGENQAAATPVEPPNPESRDV